MFTLNKKVQDKESLNDASIRLKVISDIEFKIISGEYGAGYRMPSITKLSELYNIGRTTAHKILDELFDNKILIKERGVGYFVRPYVKGNLSNKHTDALINQMKSVVSYGLNLGYDEEKLIEFFKSVFDDNKS